MKYERIMRIFIFILLILIPCLLFSQVKVRGYYRKDGTYVQPHYRSNPDGNVYNNWSTKGNINPYTGKEGTKNPIMTYSNSTVDRYGLYSSSSNSINDSYDYPKTHYPTNPPNDLYEMKIYYYDINWKGVVSKILASYHRVAYFSKNKKYGSYCIDYYVSGEIKRESGFKKINTKDDSKSVFNGDMYWYNKFEKSKRYDDVNNSILVNSQQSKTANNSNNKSDFNNYKKKEVYTTSNNTKANIVESNAISMPYYEKEGLSSEESFSLKNNSSRDINFISIRITYKLENGEIINYQDLSLKELIPNGLSKMFTIKSFDQRYKFAYKYGKTSAKSIYSLFTIEYQILNYN